jgi:hypothetical protein
VLAQTVHEEVTSIRARLVDARIAYRIDDELVTPEGGEFRFAPKTSTLPLTLGELINLINEAEEWWDDELASTGLVLGSWDRQLSNGEKVPQRSRDWIVISSAFYSQLSTYYERVFAQWALAKGVIRPQ